MRTKKVKTRGLFDKQYLTCPVCGETFEQTEETCYMINKNYTCSWKCFSNYVKEHQKPKDEQEKPKRGRPKKNVNDKDYSI